MLARFVCLEKCGGIEKKKNKKEKLMDTDNSVVTAGERVGGR